MSGERRKWHMKRPRIKYNGYPDEMEEESK